MLRVQGRQEHLRPNLLLTRRQQTNCVLLVILLQTLPLTPTYKIVVCLIFPSLFLHHFPPANFLTPTPRCVHALTK